MESTHQESARIVWDVSPVIDEELAVFPGDRGFQRKVSMSFDDDHHLALSSIETTVHIGAHADAPSHYAPKGAPIEERDVMRYLGPCQVIRVARCERIRPEQITQAIAAPRVLFATGSFSEPTEWCNDFTALSPELVHYLADRGVRLVGIDTPSVDPATDPDLGSHKAVYARDMAILEGLVLDDVPEGLYTLVAAPLRIRGADASPVRALLLRDPSVLR
jgi:arylformamidase